MWSILSAETSPRRFAFKLIKIILVLIVVVNPVKPGLEFTIIHAGFGDRDSGLNDKAARQNWCNNNAMLTNDFVGVHVNF